MFSIAWITLLRITERAILIQFCVLALVLAYVALGLDAIVLNDAAGTEQSGVMVTAVFLAAFTFFWTTIEIPREVSRKEVQIYLSKPVTRLDYLLGKIMGMSGMTLGGEIMLMGIFSLCLLIKRQPPSSWAFICGGSHGPFSDFPQCALLHGICRRRGSSRHGDVGGNLPDRICHLCRSGAGLGGLFASKVRADGGDSLSDSRFAALSLGTEGWHSHHVSASTDALYSGLVHRASGCRARNSGA
jgi:hypothetical protein